MRKYGKRLVAIFAVMTMLCPNAIAAKNKEYLVNIMFDDCITNEPSEIVDVSGTSNARIADLGNKNKAFEVDLSYVDSKITIFVPEHVTESNYVVEFDMGIEGKCGGGEVSLYTSKDIPVKFFKLDEECVLKTAEDNQRVGGIGAMNTVSVAINNDLNYFSAYLRGAEKISKRNLGMEIDRVSKIVIELTSPNAPSKAYLDNIRVYNGKEYEKLKASCKYNEEAVEFEPVDESKLLSKIFYKNSFDSASSLNLSANTTGGNTLSWEQEGEGDNKNGFMRFNKVSKDSIYTNQSLGDTGKKFVIEADYRHSKKNDCGLALVMVDDVSTGSRLFVGPIIIYEDHLYGSGVTANYKKNTWNRIALAVDLGKHIFEVYLNGEKVISKSFTTQMNILSAFRFNVQDSGFGNIDIDNISMYAGFEPRNTDDAEVVREYRFDADDSGPGYLKGKTAVQTYGNTMYAASKKQTLEHECINYGNESLIPANAFEALFKKKVTVAGETITIEGGTVMSVGSDVMTVNGAPYTLTYAPQMNDGVAYLPAVAYGNAVLGEGNFLDDEHGMLLVGSGLKAGDNRLRMANNYLFFERKTGDELLEQLKANTNDLKTHPRLMITLDDVVRLREEIKTDPYKKKWFEKIKARADSFLNAPPVEYQLSNGRLHTLSFSILSNFEIGAFTYLMTQDEKYAKRTLEEMEAVLKFKDWGHPQSFLECAHIATGFALAFDWIHDYLDEETALRLATKAQEMCVLLARDAYQNQASFNDFFWKTETNWAVLANSGPADLILATAEYNDTEDMMDILAGALRAMEYAWYRFAPDGAWHEGTGYWSYHLQFLSRFESCYSTAMGEYYGKEFKGLDKYGYFQAYFMGPDGLPNNFGDADLDNIQSEGQFLLAKMYGDKELMRYRRGQMEKYNIFPTVEDIIWYDASLSNDDSPIKLEFDKYFGEVEFVALRENWDNADSAWLSYHGGEMHSDHNHVDMGTFVFTLGGIRWAYDTGKEPLRYAQNNPAFNAGYINKHYYRGRLEGHNSVVINPTSELELDIMAPVSKATVPVSNEYGAYGSLNLTDAYKAHTSAYKRGYMLTDSRRTVVVRDEFELLANNSDVYWFMHTTGNIRIIDSKNAIIYEGGKALHVQIDASFDGELCIMDSVSLPTSPQFVMSLNEGMTKLCYKGKASGKTEITAKMALKGEIGSESGVDKTPIAQWSTALLKQGREYSYSQARLSSIKLDGVLIDGFKSDKFAYTYTKSKEGRVPEVTAASDNGEVTIESFEGLDGKSMALITVTDNSGLSTYYTITFEEYSPYRLEVYDKLPISLVGVSSEEVVPENNTYNTGDKAIDGDNSTRWSASGKNEWIIFDLGESKQIDAFAVSNWMGNQRKFNFELLVSDDNKNYEKIMAVETEGITESPVVYIPNETVKARYIKFLGHGNSINEYSHILEFMALISK